MLGSSKQGRPRRVLQLGAGTQSSVLLVMADRGDIEPVELATFADTRDEPKEVYEHLAWLEKQVKTPIVRVHSGDMVAESVVYQKSHKGVDGRYASLPFFTANGMQQRQCTKYYKIVPIHQYIRRAVLGLQKGERVPAGTRITQVFGISFDERSRMAKPRNRYTTNEYPFVDRALRREAVIAMAERWFPDHKFPRSACIRCPYRNDAEWRSLAPEEFAAACDYDDEMRSLDFAAGGNGVYLHRSRIPLRVVNLSPVDSLFDGVADNECEGMCSV